MCGDAYLYTILGTLRQDGKYFKVSLGYIKSRQNKNKKQEEEGMEGSIDRGNEGGKELGRKA